MEIPAKGSATNWIQWSLRSWTWLILAFFYLPILLLAAYSFNDSKLNIVWAGFTTRWYVQLFHNHTLLEAFRNSLFIAFLSTIAATFMGTAGAWVLHRYRFPFATAIALLIFIPMVIPEVLMGVSLLSLFSSLGMPRGFLTVIIAHVTFCFPFVLIAVQARLDGIDPFLEEAAMDLGAPPAKAFVLVILPYLMPAVISGGLMAFTLSLDEYIVTLFTTGAQSQTLPLKVYGMAKTGLNPQLNALSTIFVAVTILLVIFREVIKKINAR